MNEFDKKLKDLKYHKDEVKRRHLTSEEIEFLQSLQTELNTQDHIGQADPRYWVIRDWNKVYGDNLYNPDGVEIFDTEGTQLADIAFTFFRNKTETLTQIIEKRYKEIYSEDEVPEDLSLQIADADISGTIIDTVKEINKTYDLGITAVEYETVPSESGFFLTHKAALKHLSQNYYHYTDKAIPYAKTAWRSDEEVLWKILQETDWNHYAPAIEPNNNPSGIYLNEKDII